MNALRAPAARLGTGSMTLLRQLAAWLTPGTFKGMAQRVAGAFVLGWFLAGVLYAAPGLLWVAAAAWVAAALRAPGTAPAADKPPPAAARPPARPADTERTRLLATLEQITAGRNGIHLTRLWEQMRLRPPYADLEDPELRALLTKHGVPVHRSMTADRVSGRSGIKRADVERLLAPPPPPPAPLSGAESATDLRESRSLSARPEAGEGVNSPCSDA